MNTTSSRDQEAAFNRYYELRLARAGAITPGQKLAVLDELERELLEEGRLPLPSGPVRVDVNHPIVRAVLEGRSVVMGATSVAAPTTGFQTRLMALPVWGKFLFLGGVFVAFVVVVFGIGGLLRGGNDEPVVTAAEPTPSQTVTPSPTAGLLTPSATPLPEPTATPYALALTTGEAADAGNDPASVEIAGFSYVLGVGTVVNGEWTPAAAEWLADTDLHRVIAVPWEPNLANAVNTLRPGNLITVRLRSGELAKYKIATVARVQRQQIEVLAGRSPGLSVVLYGEPNDQRTVIVATALQTPPDPNTYTAGLPLPSPSAVAGMPSITDTLSIQTVQVTDTLTITHSIADIALSVNGCSRVAEVQGQPAPEREDYLVCDISLTNVGTDTVRFSDQAFGITERAWWEVRVDWLPTLNVSVTEALGSGTLAPGASARGRILGLVIRPKGGLGVNTTPSTPVLLWVQDGVRYVVTLPN